MLLIAQSFLLALAAQSSVQACQGPEAPWICQQQQVDGSWNAQAVPDGLGEEVSFVPGKTSDDVVVTALNLLAILSSDSTPDVGRQKRNVVRALDWLVREQAETGKLARASSTTPLTDHAIAAVALSEAHYWSTKPRYKKAAQSALAHLERTALAGGGWSSSGEPNGEVDFRATLWATLALVSGRDARLTQRPQLIAAAAWRLRSEAATRSRKTTREITFELLTRVLAGETANTSDELSLRVTALFALPFDWNRTGEGFDAECLFVRSLIAYRTGGPTWKRWQRTLKQVLAQPGDSKSKWLLVDAKTPGGSLAAHAWTSMSLGLYFHYARIVGAR